MNFDKERAAIFFFYTRHIGMTSSTEPYSLMKIFLTVFKIEGIAALTINGRLYSESIKVRVVILVCDIFSRCVLHYCEVS